MRQASSASAQAARDAAQARAAHDLALRLEADAARAEQEAAARVEAAWARVVVEDPIGGMHPQPRLKPDVGPVVVRCAGRRAS